MVALASINSYNWYSDMVKSKQVIHGLLMQDVSKGVVEVRTGELRCRHPVEVEDANGSTSTSMCGTDTSATPNLRKHYCGLHDVEVDFGRSGKLSKANLPEVKAFWDGLKAGDEAHLGSAATSTTSNVNGVEPQVEQGEAEPAAKQKQVTTVFDTEAIDRKLEAARAKREAIELEMKHKLEKQDLEEKALETRRARCT